MGIIKGDIIFDLDGTLWDSSQGVASSWNATIEAASNPLLRQKNLTKDDIRAVMGLPMDDIAERIFPDLSKKAAMEMLDKCGEEENNYLAEHGGILFRDEDEVLDYISRSHRLFIVSNCQCGYIEAFFESSKLERYFSDYLCWGDTGREKSFTIRKLMTKNDCVDAVYVGDTRGDYLSAVSSRIPFIHAAYGFGKLLPGDNAAGVLNKFSDLKDMI